MLSEIRQVLENSHLFSGLNPVLLDEIAASATKRTLGARELLFQKGDRAYALWGVLSGRILIKVRADDGKEMVVDEYQAGDVFGEVGVLDFGPRRAEASAVCKSELFCIERSHFLQHLHANPELCFRTFSLLCSHLRDTTETLEDTVLYRLPGRLAKRLLLMTHEAADHDGSEALNIGQSELARMMGVHREAVNRQLREWEKSGWIAIQRQRIEILNEKKLAGLAAPGQIVEHRTWDIESHYSAESAAEGNNRNLETTQGQSERRSAGILAIDCLEYASMLMRDSGKTINRIKAGLAAIDTSIRANRGQVIWSAGDRTLAEFPDGATAVDAAMEIQRTTGEKNSATTGQSGPIFRIGIHSGEILASNGRIIGEPVNIAIRLTELSGSGGICLSGEVRDALEVPGNLQLQYLGKHELKNIPDPVRVFSARAIPWINRLFLRAETLVPRRFRLAAFATALIVMFLGIWFTADRMGRQRALPSVSQLSIAVLPFTSSGEPAFDYLARGIPNEIGNVLSTISGMRVIGRESAGFFDTHIASADEIGRALDVEWLLRGNLENSGEQISVTAQLINAANNAVVWEEQFLDSNEGFSGFAPEIVRHVADSLGIIDDDGAGLPKLAPLTSHAEAHALYLEAQNHIWLGRQPYMINAVPLLQMAVELDPSFAEAHAVLAGLYLTLYLLDDQEQYNPDIRQELARQSLQKGLSLKPDSPLVLAEASKVRFRDEDYDGALALAERALRIDPNNTEALRARYWVQWKQQERAGALQTSERIMRLEPLSMLAMAAYWTELNNADRHQEGLAIAERALAFYAESEVPHAHAWAADSKSNLGDRLGAIESSRKGMPYGTPYDLWTGLEYDWNFFDKLDPLRSIVGLVYVEEYEQIRQILIDTFDGVGPNSIGAQSGVYLSELDYLINRGELEALAGDFETSIGFFEKARLLTPEEGGGLVSATINYAVLDWSRQSHWALALLFAHRKTGQHEEADIIAGQIEDMTSEYIEAIATVSALADNRNLYAAAQYHAIEGRNDEALNKLRTWLNYGMDIFTYIKWDPYLDSLRGDPRFKAIVAEVEVKLAGIRAQYHAKQVASE